MTQEINVWTSNWKKTGVKVSVPQYSVDVRVQATKWDGTKVDITETIKFPNFLNNVGVNDLKEWLTELMLREARQRLAGEE